MLTGAVFVFCSSLAVHSSVLAWRGEWVEAVVTDVAEGR
jgi:hypothetical protein